MRFREYFWGRVVPVYFMAVTILNVVIMVIGSILQPEARFGYDAFLSPLIFGLLAIIPVLLSYFGKEQTVRQIILQKAVRLGLAELLVLGFCWAEHMIDSTRVFGIMAAAVFTVFLLINLLLWIYGCRMSSELNQALKIYKKGGC